MSECMRFRPCIDLHEGVVKQIVGSSLKDGEKPTENFSAILPANEFAEMFKRDGLKGGHVIALGAGNDEAMMSAIKAYPGGLQVGGGVNPSNAMQLLDAGASHVIVTSYVFVDGKLDMARLEEMTDLVGKDRLVVDLSCRKKDDKYWVVADRWQTFTNLEVNVETLRNLAQFCDEFLVHGVDVEGKMCGIEDELIQMLGEHSPIPVTYAGGATSVADLDRVKALGQGKVDLTIGSALDIYGGDVPYDAVVAWQRKEEEFEKQSKMGAFGFGGSFGRTYS